MRPLPFPIFSLKALSSSIELFFLFLAILFLVTPDEKSPHVRYNKLRDFDLF